MQNINFQNVCTLMLINCDMYMQGCHWRVMKYVTNWPKGGYNDINIVNSYVNNCWSEASHTSHDFSRIHDVMTSLHMYWTPIFTPLLQSVVVYDPSYRVKVQINQIKMAILHVNLVLYMGFPSLDACKSHITCQTN